jgi:transcriptional regulator with XRE-family HTH domain
MAITLLAVAAATPAWHSLVVLLAALFDADVVPAAVAVTGPLSSDRQDRIVDLVQPLAVYFSQYSELAGINKVTLVHIERGKTSPNVDTLAKLADALGVEIADFFPKSQPPLFSWGQWGAGAKYEAPPLPERGGPEPRHLQPGERLKSYRVPAPEGMTSGGRPGYGRLEDLTPFTAPAPEWFMPRLQRIERGEMTADEFMKEIEEYAAHGS